MTWAFLNWVGEIKVCGPWVVSGKPDWGPGGSGMGWSLGFGPQERYRGDRDNGSEKLVAKIGVGIYKDPDFEKK